MKGSLHLATVSGIPVKIHWSFGLLLLWVAYETSKGGFQPWLLLISIGIVLSVFFCVILHEFGHALAARRYGVQTHDIMMTPIGGIARLERMPEGRGQEFWVALAGPVVNFTIVGLIWFGYLLIQGTSLPMFSLSFWRLDHETFSYFKILMLANGYLGLFNLLPAFPMDGGRMLRSLLSLRMDRTAATRIASFAGQSIAIIMFAIGISRSQPTLTLIGVFIFFAARQEYQVLVRQARMQRIRAADLMDPIDHQFFLGQTLDTARQIISSLKGQAFVVWSRPGIPAGFITREQLLTADVVPGENLYLDEKMVPTPMAVAPELSASQLFTLMQQHKIPVVLVYDQVQYIGIIPWEKVTGLLR